MECEVASPASEKPILLATIGSLAYLAKKHCVIENKDFLTSFFKFSSEKQGVAIFFITSSSHIGVAAQFLF